MQNKKIMISEGAIFLRSEVKEMLGSLGNMQVIEASSAEETREKLANEQPDIVLINVDLCRGDNSFSVRQALETQEQTKILVIGTRDNVSEVEDLVAQGAQDFLLRPFQAEDLHLKIHGMGV